MKTLTELTTEYYALIGGEHHKDQDCHFYIQKIYSYGDEPYWQFLHYGYCWSVENFFQDEANREKYKTYLNPPSHILFGIEYTADMNRIFSNEFPERQTEQEAEEDMRNFLEWAIKKEKELREREDAGD
jgi:hypothetical protein